MTLTTYGSSKAIKVLSMADILKQDLDKAPSNEVVTSKNHDGSVQTRAYLKDSSLWAEIAKPTNESSVQTIKFIPTSKSFPWKLDSNIHWRKSGKVVSSWAK